MTTASAWYIGTGSSTITSNPNWDIYVNPPVVQRVVNTVPPPIKHLKQEHSPNCCGCDFMSWFPQPDAAGHVSQKVVDQVEDQLKQHKVTYNSMMLVILNNLQRPFYEKMLLAQGYKVVMDKVFHPGHGHNLTLYGYEKHPNHPNAPRS